MAGKHRNLVHVGRVSQRREIPHLHVLNHALSKWCHHRKLLCEIEFAGISNSIVSQRACSAKKISDESEITEEWKEVSGRRTTSRSCYYRDSGLVQLPIMSTRRPRGGGFKALIFGQASPISPTARPGRGTSPTSPPPRVDTSAVNHSSYFLPRNTSAIL